MAGEPSLGTRIRRARERLVVDGHTMTQAELGAAIGKSRSAVNAWEQDRALPRNAIGALEQVLGVDLTAGTYTDVYAEVYSDPDEARIWSWTDLTVEKRRAMIADLRQARAAARKAS